MAVRIIGGAWCSGPALRLWDRRRACGPAPARWASRGTSPPASLDDRSRRLLAKGGGLFFFFFKSSIQAMAAAAARSAAEAGQLRGRDLGRIGLLEVVAQCTPPCLIGTSTVAGAFDSVCG